MRKKTTCTAVICNHLCTHCREQKIVHGLLARCKARSLEIVHGRKWLDEKFMGVWPRYSHP